MNHSHLYTEGTFFFAFFLYISIITDSYIVGSNQKTIIKEVLIVCGNYFIKISLYTCVYIQSLCCLNVCGLIDHQNECLLFSHSKGFNENKNQT